MPFLPYLNGLKYMCSCMSISIHSIFNECKHVTENFAFNSVQKVVINGQLQNGCFLIV